MKSSETIFFLNSKYLNENDLPHSDTLSCLLIQKKCVIDIFYLKETSSQVLFSQNHNPVHNRINSNPYHNSNIKSIFLANTKTNSANNSQKFKVKLNGNCLKCGKIGQKESDCRVKTNKSIDNARNRNPNCRKKY